MITSPRYLSIVLLFSLLSSGAALLLSFHFNAVAIRKQEQIQARQNEVGRQATCSLIAAQVAVYAETPPISAAGRNAAGAWHDLSIQFHCS